MVDLTEQKTGTQVRAGRMNAMTMCLGLALVVLVAGCDRLKSPVVPSITPLTPPEAHGTGGDRYYKASILPATADAGTEQSFTIRITNCDAPSCSEANHSSSNQTIKSATIAVPAGFTVDGSSLSTSLSIAGSWTATLVGNTIQLNKADGNDNLPTGGWVEVTFDATAPCAAGAYTWSTAAFNGADYTTPYTLFGTHPAVTVEGTCAAQACSPGFWKQSFHFDEWPNPPAPSDLFQSIFSRLITVGQKGQDPGITNPTLLEALRAGGGDVTRVARIGTAAYLSAAHTGVAYPYTTAQVVLAVQQAIDGVAFTGPSIDDLENVWKLSLDPNHCPLGEDPGDID
jgi:hypothetical protein